MQGDKQLHVNNCLKRWTQWNVCSHDTTESFDDKTKRWMDKNLCINIIRDLHTVDITGETVHIMAD